ncbi:hypothetical protein WCD74_27980 [Actinomycetospora sp. OC33-EN08]|uniref:CopG family transcriptional regulator n=1 Tax=Actinomycetospora aurantiaca TaxID=3129233 RepID=A0ABU8MWJ9_9PSEU
MAAKRRVSFSIDEFSLELLQAAADRAGKPLSAWLAKAAMSEAVRQGAPRENTWDEAAAVAEDAALAADEATLRAQG